MSKNFNSIIRRLAVIYLIVSSLLVSVLLFVFKQPMWASMVIAIFTLVLIWEAYSLIRHGHTISTEYKLWVRRESLKARICIILLISSFISLGVHLWFK